MHQSSTQQRTFSAKPSQSKSAGQKQQAQTRIDKIPQSMVGSGQYIHTAIYNQGGCVVINNQMPIQTSFHNRPTHMKTKSFQSGQTGALDKGIVFSQVKPTSHQQQDTKLPIYTSSFRGHKKQSLSMVQKNVIIDRSDAGNTKYAIVSDLEQPVARSIDNSHKVNKTTAAHSQHMDNSEAELIKVLQEPLNTFHNQPSNSFSGGSMFAIGS